jgi:serine/threonine protein phosphatase 1
MKSKKTFITADIHGNLKAYLQCMERSGFNKDMDRLICLGDVVDGYPETKETIEELLKVENLILIKSNHDSWCLDWAEHPDWLPEFQWVNQGGRATIASYMGKMPQSHIDFLQSAKLFHEEDNKLFVHGGVKRDCKAEECSEDFLLWDRTLADLIYAKREKSEKLTLYDEVFIGHTSTLCYGITEPMHAYEVWDLDTGAGYDGKLTFMDLETKQYWQSDRADTLYLGYKHR